MLKGVDEFSDFVTCCPETDCFPRLSQFATRKEAPYVKGTVGVPRESTHSQQSSQQQALHVFKFEKDSVVMGDACGLLILEGNTWGSKRVFPTYFHRVAARGGLYTLAKSE